METKVDSMTTMETKTNRESEMQKFIDWGDKLEFATKIRERLLDYNILTSVLTKENQRRLCEEMDRLVASQLDLLMDEKERETLCQALEKRRIAAVMVKIREAIRSNEPEKAKSLVEDETDGELLGYVWDEPT